MPTITLPFETWRVDVDALRGPGLPQYMAEHADGIEGLLDGLGPGEAAVSLSLRDDVYLRGYTWARLTPGIDLPLPQEHRDDRG